MLKAGSLSSYAKRLQCCDSKTLHTNIVTSLDPNQSVLAQRLSKFLEPLVSVFTFALQHLLSLPLLVPHKPSTCVPRERVWGAKRRVPWTPPSLQVWAPLPCQGLRLPACSFLPSSFSTTHLTHPLSPRDMHFPVTPGVLQKSRPKDV